MIFYIILAAIHIIFAPLVLLWQQVDLHLDQNPYLIAFISWLDTLNRFLPITDAIFPMLVFRFVIIAAPLIQYQIALKLVNLIRGSGLK